MDHKSEYTPLALPPLWEALRDRAHAVRADRAILVGSAIRDADNGVEPTSYSLYLMPGPYDETGYKPVGQIVQDFLKLSGPNSHYRREDYRTARYETGLGTGETLNITFCSEAYMFKPHTMAFNVPIGLSAVTMDLFSGKVYAAPAYHHDKQNQVITQLDPNRDEDNKAVRSIQKRYPTYPVMRAGESKPLFQAISKVLANA